MTVTRQWQVLSRPDCSLCENLMRELMVLLGDAGDTAAQVQVIDVDDFPDLERKYGHRIPVLLVDGEFLCDYRLDSERVKRYLAAF